MLLFTPSLINYVDAFVSIATTTPTTPIRRSSFENKNNRQQSSLLQHKVQQSQQRHGHGRYQVVTTTFASSPNNNRNDIDVQQKQYNTDNNDNNKEEENDDDNNNIKPVVHYLILPGFGNDSSDYTKHKSLVPSLRSRLMAADKKRRKRRRRINNNNNNNKNLHDDYIVSSHDDGDNDDNNNNIHVLPIKRIDWLQIFVHGIFDKDFWHCTLSPTNPSYKWYLDAVYDEVNRIVTKTEEKEKQGEYEGKRRPVKVVLVGHSAGGWLARAAVGFGCSNNAANNDIDTKISSNNSNNHHNEQQQQKQQQQQQQQQKKRTFALDHIAGIVSLGSPHHPPPQGAMDMTRGALRITNEQFPGTHHAPDIFYVTVVGNAIKGKQEEAGYEPTSMAAFAHQSYELVCGNGDAIGDGIVPIQSAHLDDAIQVELDNVFHSITVPMQKWYGTESIVDKWLTVVTEQIEKSLLQYRHTGTCIIKNSRIEQQQQQQLNPTLIMQTNTTSLG